MERDCSWRTAARRVDPAVVRCPPPARAGLPGLVLASTRILIRRTFLLHRTGDRPRRLSPCSRSLRVRSHHRHHLRRRRAPDRPHRQRVLLGLARSAADPRLRRSQVAELSRACASAGASRSTSWPGAGGRSRAASPPRASTSSTASPHRIGDLGVPLIDGALAQLECRHRAARTSRAITRSSSAASSAARDRRGRAAALLPRPVRPAGRIPAQEPDRDRDSAVPSAGGRRDQAGRAGRHRLPPVHPRPRVPAFEAELARYVGVAPRVLSSSATAALWLTLRALGVKAGDEILVPSHTAFPTIEAICFADGHAGLRRRRRLLHDGSRRRRRAR